MAIVLHSEGIVDEIMKDYSKIASVLKDKKYRMHMIKALQASQALVAFSGSPMLKAEKKGTDNLITWAEYHPAILKHLKGFKSELEFLHGARYDIADEIYRLHHKRFPRWPAVGSENSDRLNLDKSGNYTAEYDGMKWEVVWECHGCIDVVDKHPSENEYYCDFKGDPELKCVSLDLVKLKQLNKMLELHGVSKWKQRAEIEYGTSAPEIEWKF